MPYGQRHGHADIAEQVALAPYGLCQVHGRFTKAWTNANIGPDAVMLSRRPDLRAPGVILQVGGVVVRSGAHGAIGSEQSNFGVDRRTLALKTCGP